MVSNLIEMVFGVFTGLLALLPASFVNTYLDNSSFSSVLGIMNYFIPVSTFVEIGTAWLSCCGAFLVYRYVKAAYKSAKEN